MSEQAQVLPYPRYCFHLSPTANNWCLLRVSDIHALKQHAGFEGENFFFYRNLPIKWVRVVGPVVAIDEFHGRRVYTIDDSSGKCIEALINMQPPTPVNNVAELQYQPGTAAGDAANPGALHILDPPGPYGNVDVGDVVDVKGALSTFRDEKQIKIEKLLIVKSTAQEVKMWGRRSKFRHEVLDNPWILSDKEIRRCRKEAEASQAGSERKKKRLAANSEASTSTRQIKAKTLAPGLSHESVKPKAKEKTNLKLDTAARVKALIRQGSAKGKYSALGL
ncbi:telomere regulation protein [Metarhizium robertsii]|uniref:Glycoside hydrolase family 81 protein n=2 Tax=Metarhizium robertsii TaxID=568076 RepID=E9EQT4_METRA|nr:glycoside hydrolase family 81 protein [Metarhizium robertsii ARSEF 23]EFZ02590.2 glycoside hydrolase family 81 protein [Metarhizium robertsii ARSEF 23]EXV05797.1 telomere regulation protein [Metarhizium robertsii]